MHPGHPSKQLHCAWGLSEFGGYVPGLGVETLSEPELDEVLGTSPWGSVACRCFCNNQIFQNRSFPSNDTDVSSEFYLMTCIYRLTLHRLFEC